MSTDIEKIMGVIEVFWQWPLDASEREKEGYALELLKRAISGDSLESIKFHLSKIQTNRLRQHLDLTACESIASRICDLFRTARQTSSQALDAFGSRICP